MSPFLREMWMGWLVDQICILQAFISWTNLVVTLIISSALSQRLITRRDGFVFIKREGAGYAVCIVVARFWQQGMKRVAGLTWVPQGEAILRRSQACRRPTK